MKFHIITIFPDQLEKSLKYGVIGKALETNTIELNLIDPRKFSDNDYGSIDDKPYGGGPGMVMQCEPVLYSIEIGVISNILFLIFILLPSFAINLL